MKIQLQDYPLTSTIIKLKTGRVQLTLIKEPDWFLEQLSQEDSEGKLYLPYWTYLWESSIGLARPCRENRDTAKRRTYLGNRVRIWTHRDRRMSNGCASDFSQMQNTEHSVSHITTPDQNGVSQSADFVQMDWNTPCFNCRFPYILAADVIYEEHHWMPIVTLLQNYLTPNGIALFSEPNRNNAIGFFN